jgi:hypothetical protein
MKKIIRSNPALNLAALSLLLLPFASCNKDASVDTAANNANQSAAQAIAIASTSGGDSVYVVGACAAHHRTESVAFSSLPAAIGTYLKANYAGYSAQKAFTDKESSGTVSGYIVVINYNSKPVGLKFDATGAFVKVLEQREERDLNCEHGFHAGGHFDDRDGLKRDTIAISALPATVTSYFSANYAQDTLVRAFRGKDSTIVVLSVNNGPYATVFSTTGTFLQRAALPARPGRLASIAQEALPADALSYLSATYPNYVFKYAFAIKANGVNAGYAALIDANATKYALLFDASGNFLTVITIR